MAEGYTFTGADGKPVTISEERFCPLVSSAGPECPNCGADPLNVNLDPYNGWGFCQECGSRFKLPKVRRNTSSEKPD